MNRTVVVAALGTAQTLACASSYYLPAFLADPIAQGTGVSRTIVFGLFLRRPAALRHLWSRGGRGRAKWSIFTQYVLTQLLIDDSGY
jgi:hypothetical protein